MLPDDSWPEFDDIGSPDDSAVETQSDACSPEPSQSVDVEESQNAARSNENRRTHARLPLLQLADWSEELPYDEQPPTCIHYSIEWKLTINSKGVSKDTEQDLVLAPGAFWRRTLRPKLEKLLLKKLPSNKSFKADDTNITVSVRSQRALVKSFDELDIDWTVVEKQLQTWSHLFAMGKELRIDISFNYVETGPAGTSLVRGTKRGYASVSQQMLSERAMQLDAEEASSGQPSIWRNVYNLMRCPGPPCHLGPHCWRDDAGKRHYRLKTHHLRKLIQFVEHGGRLESHEDVPEEIRDQLREQLPARRGPHRHLRKQGYLCHQILLEIAGPRDAAVKKYSAWQCSQVDDRMLKMEYQKACAITLAEGLDLELVHEDQDADLYIKNGVKKGVARRFVRDIGTWAKHHAA
ncbi:hypothetical protein NKR23_g12307 [Pleurostoma richardsiae]|uniref:Uncharacterized protein n=1 Tax=Pleurostoma richardsiae TaxID=41990 RepID=A0AA38R2D0_9PEZI|nr:hypothetical protein NKR23_g12307 [Pleurostoma richardsiae]